MVVLALVAHGLWLSCLENSLKMLVCMAQGPLQGAEELRRVLTEVGLIVACHLFCTCIPFFMVNVLYWLLSLCGAIFHLFYRSDKHATNLYIIILKETVHLRKIRIFLISFK